MRDLELFKCNLNQIPFGVFTLVDKGYQEMYPLYPNGLLSLKTKRRYNLNPELKIYHQEINKRRSGIGHVFWILKTFKIIAKHPPNQGKE
ncbi:hypothetical protein B9T26_00915 [Acinetobacter sp. ANC 4169]|uniref:hypothetical protein n=1 Tax=Acinetobacter sp. ANC 4169 TaxID=1977879 RepID=UPI000A3593C1|nr:hypothetical protein [Acinetobacter sp. ANC 4169]OTG77173.1 hypothetical protein B9T26_00915 [Acinetobacter sp. ANC 4169]